jgi:hypothetical protein
MPKHFKVHELLNAAELAELEAFAREPARTVDACHEWMESRGFVIHRSAVGSWKSAFLAEEKFSAAGQVSRAVIDAAKEGGVESIADATLLTVGQMVFEKSLEMQSQQSVSVKDLVNIGKAINNVIVSKGDVDELKARQKTAIEEASKAAASGADANAVVNKVREILGVA